jgi:hypothetical protein
MFVFDAVMTAITAKPQRLFDIKITGFPIFETGALY